MAPLLIRFCAIIRGRWCQPARGSPRTKWLLLQCYYDTTRTATRRKSRSLPENRSNRKADSKLFCQWPSPNKVNASEADSPGQCITNTFTETCMFCTLRHSSFCTVQNLILPPLHNSPGLIAGEMRVLYESGWRCELEWAKFWEALIVVSCPISGLNLPKCTAYFLNLFPSAKCKLFYESHFYCKIFALSKLFY